MEEIGKVLLSTSLGFQVHFASGREVIAPRRKNLDVKKGNIIIGDEVILDEDNQIKDILPRKNSLDRPRVVNLDMAGVLVSAKKPDFTFFLLDKYLTACLKGNVPSFIVVSKWDLASPSEKAKITKALKFYEDLGYSTYKVGLDTPIEDEKIRQKVKGKISILMGQTGVGKSSLINRLDKDFKRPVGNEVILGRGEHKTKEVAFLPFLGGYLGDTPGFSDFLLDLTKEELALDFPGYFDYAQECKFKGCLHNGIKGCKVEEAVKAKKLSEESYSNYLRLLKETSQDKGFEKKSTHKEWGKRKK